MNEPIAKILCIGEPLIESIGVKDESGKLSNVEPTGFAGDMAPNFATYARMAADALKVPCEIDVLTALGGTNDEPSNNAVKDMEARGLNLHPDSKRIEGKKMGSVINLKTPAGDTHPDKVQMDRADSAFRDLLNDTTDDKLKEIVNGYSHIVVSGIPLACVREREKLVKLLEYAKEQGSKIIVSTNLRPANWKMADNEDPTTPPMEKAQKWLDKIIPLADIIFANATDEKNVRGSNTRAITSKTLRELNPTAEIVVTDDDKPITLRYHNPAKGSDSVYDIAVPQEKIVDTTGAGDSLAATALIGRMKHHNLHQAVERGSFIASQVIGFKGALPKVGVALDYETPTRGPQPQL